MKGRVRLGIEGLGWLTAWRVSRALPERMVVAGFEKLFARSYRRNARQRAVVTRNLEPVVGTAAAPSVAREAFRWYGRYWAETFRMQDVSRAELDRRVRVFGEEHLARAQAQGRGVLLITAHLGNWDVGGRWAAERWPLSAVVEVLRPQMLFDRFVEYRRSIGMNIIPLERGADVTARCVEALGRGDILGLVCDRDLSSSGVEVRMFGRIAKFPPGAAVLALRTGAPILPAFAYQRVDGTWDAHVEPPIEMPDPSDPDAVPVIMQRFAAVLERFIVAEPAQWHVFSRYWIDE